MIGLGLSIPQTAIRNAILQAFNPSSLFASGEQGVWYDPSDFSTMFQDAAGTIPVTAVGQPVGRILDKSGRGNHATQTTTTSRPLLSALVNMLTKTEQFNDAAWIKNSSTVTASSEAVPIGLNTAFIYNEGTNTFRDLREQIAVAANTQTTLSIYVKNITANFVTLSIRGNPSNYAAVEYNLTNGTVSRTAQLGTGYVVNSSSITNAGNGWYLLKAILTFGTDVTQPQYKFSTSNGTSLFASNGTVDFLGTSRTVYIGAADFRTTNVGNAIPSYQRVNTATDYDTTGFPYYLSFDGVDDWLVTGSVNFTATNKVTLWAGVRKLSDASAGIVVELSPSTVTNKNAFDIRAPSATSGSYFFRSVGSLFAGDAEALGFAAPITNVLTALGNIANDQSILKVNGIQVASGVADQGSGNYGDYPIYIGRRGGTTFPFNGRLYSLIVRGADSTTQQITDTEKYVAGKTGLTL